MNKLENFSQSKISKEEVTHLYNSLPEQMKTGYFGFVLEEPYFNTWEEATESHNEAGRSSELPLTYVIIRFSDGREISLHLNYKAKEGSLLSHIKKQISDIEEASRDSTDIVNTRVVYK